MDSNKNYWKGLEELHQTPAFVENKSAEFKEEIPIENVISEAGLSTKTPRRDFLKALGFGVGAVTLAACQTTPVHKSIPYIIKPEEIVPGVANYYASSYKGQSLVVKTREGRPIFIEANPRAAYSSTGVSPATQASVLDLYDMSKLNGPRLEGDTISWEDLDKRVISALDAAANAGKQIAIVASTIYSPSALATINEFIAKYPTAKLVQVDAVSYTGIIRANERSFGQAVVPQYRFDNADIIVSVGADFLGSWLDGIEYTRQYMTNRNHTSLKSGKMSRHIQFESGLSLTGTNADVRVSMKPSEEGALLIALYNELTGSALPNALKDNQKAATAIKLVATELSGANGRALVVSGSNDINVQTLVNAINAHLGSYGSTIDLDSPSNQYKGDDTAFAQFISDANAGLVDVAFFVESNPMYEYFDAKAVESALDKIKFKVSFADRIDETASKANVLAPSTSYLESWGDAEPYAGYFTLVHQTINVVFDALQYEQSLLIWAGNTTSYHDYVKTYWEQNILPAGKNWFDSLQEGFVLSGGRSAASAKAFGGSVAELANQIGT